MFYVLLQFSYWKWAGDSPIFTPLRCVKIGAVPEAVSGFEQFSDIDQVYLSTFACVG